MARPISTQAQQWGNMQAEEEISRAFARLAAVEKDLIARYGSASQARVIFLYEQLVTIRMALLRPGSSAAERILADRRIQLRNAIQTLYNNSRFPGDPAPVRVVSVSPRIVEFDRDRYTERYAGVAGMIQHEIVTLKQWRPQYTVRPVAYMYVVDDNGRFLVWNRPFRMADLVLGRNRATVDGVPVAHPMLVPDRLRVAAAGEVVPVANGRLCGLVANLKSGHYRPPPSSADSVVRASRAAGLSDQDCDVFTVPEPPGFEVDA